MTTAQWVDFFGGLKDVALEINNNAHAKGFYPTACSKCSGGGFIETTLTNSSGDDVFVQIYCRDCQGSGFKDGKHPRTFGDTCALLISEISEAFEGFRHHNPPSEHIPEFTSIEEEFADVFIRLLDEAHERKIRLAEAVYAKMEFNSGREYRHGGKAV